MFTSLWNCNFPPFVVSMCFLMLSYVRSLVVALIRSLLFLYSTHIFLLHWLYFKSDWWRALRPYCRQGLIYRKRCKQIDKANYAGRGLYAWSRNCSPGLEGNLNWELLVRVDTFVWIHKISFKAGKSTIREPRWRLQYQGQRFRFVKGHRFRYDGDRLWYTRLCW